MANKISFTILIGERNWNGEIGGWYCPALKIPTSEIEAIYENGSKVDDRKYGIIRGNAMIIWAEASTRPVEATVSIVIKDELTTIDETKKAEQLAHEAIQKALKKENETHEAKQEIVKKEKEAQEAKQETLEKKKEAQEAKLESIRYQEQALKNQRLGYVYSLISAIVVALIPVVFPAVIHWLPNQPPTKTENKHVEKSISLTELGLKMYVIQPPNDSLNEVDANIFFKSAKILQDTTKSLEITLKFTQNDSSSDKQFEIYVRPPAGNIFDLSNDANMEGLIPDHRPDGTYYRLTNLKNLQHTEVLVKIPLL